MMDWAQQFDVIGEGMLRWDGVRVRWGLVAL